MALTVVNVGKKVLLDYLLTLGNFYYHLYKTDTAISRTSVAADFTPANYAGYAAQLAAGWSVAALDGSNRATSNANQMTFSATGGPSNSIYGYVVAASNSLGGGPTVYWAERFSMAPITMGAAGDTILLTPNCTLKSEFNN